MSPKKKYSRTMKNAAGSKVRILRRKAILKALKAAHTEIQGVVDLIAQGAMFAHETLPSFDHTAWEHKMRALVNEIETVGNDIHN